SLQLEGNGVDLETSRLTDVRGMPTIRRARRLAVGKRLLWVRSGHRPAHQRSGRRSQPPPRTCHPNLNRRSERSDVRETKFNSSLEASTTCQPAWCMRRG